MVQATRLGTVFAYDLRAFRSWHRKRERQHGRPAGLVGTALEVAVSALRFTNPEYVVEGR